MVQGLQPSPDTHVLVRVARPADAASLIAHRRRSCAESFFLAFYPDEVSDDVEAQARIIEAAGADPHRAILVATTGDEVIGFAGYLPAGPGRKAAHRASIALSVEEALPAAASGAPCSPPSRTTPGPRASANSSLASMRKTHGHDGSTSTSAS